MTDPTEDRSEPEIRIVSGHPTDEEIAAVVAVVRARAAGAPTADEPEPRSGWAAYWRAVRAPLRPGPGSWQQAYRR